MLKITKDSEAYWLHVVSGGKKAMLNLGDSHGPIVTAVLDEATITNRELYIGNQAGNSQVVTGSRPPKQMLTAG